MSCVWAEKISLLVDGELAREEAREAERHLDSCAACRLAREDFLFLRRQLSAYRSEPNPAAQAEALAGILASKAGAARGDALRDTATETAWRKKRGGWRARLAGTFAAPRPAPAMAALALLLVAAAAGVLAYLNSHGAPRRAASVAATGRALGGWRGVIKRPDEDAARREQGSVAVRDDSARGADGARVTVGVNDRAGRRDDAPLVAAVVRPKEMGVRRRAPATKGATGSAVGAGAASVMASLGTPGRRAPESVVARAPGGAAVSPYDAAGFALAPVPAAPDLTARHVEQAQLLLRSFRNARLADAERGAGGGAEEVAGGGEDLAYERERSRRLLYRNIVLRREAASRGDVPVERLLDRLEPILIDIANLPDRPQDEDVRPIRERMRKKNIVSMLQVNLASR